MSQNIDSNYLCQGGCIFIGICLLAGLCKNYSADFHKIQWKGGMGETTLVVIRIKLCWVTVTVGFGL